jgi:predicted DNA-binding WGR domain protein
MTKGQVMKKWCLLASSDRGPMGRGQNGKKKVYEVTVDGSTLRCSWGMAEKPQRQTSVQVYHSSQAAMSAAYEKVYAKRDKGYALAYEV